MNIQLKLKETRENIAAKELEYRGILSGEMTVEARTKMDGLLAEIETLKSDEQRFNNAFEMEKKKKTSHQVFRLIT
jgi:hypothetical protein